MRPQDAKGVLVEGETMMGTWGKLSKAQSPITIPWAASHLQWTHPNQPTNRKEQYIKYKNYFQGRNNMVWTHESCYGST